MRIQSYFQEPSPLAPLSFRYICRNGDAQDNAESVLREHHLRAVLDEGTSMEFLCLPQFLPELILGHLVTEGCISRPEDVDSVYIDESGENAVVHFRPGVQAHDLAPLPPVCWENDWVFALADRFAEGMPLHRQTFATHSCFLACQGQFLFQCEDLGRHNAVDKAVGFALRKNIPLAQCLLYSSGRMPLDMVRKAIYAGIPVLASKGAPTAQAVALARKYGLNLICAARRDSMKQFSGPAWASSPEDAR